MVNLYPVSEADVIQWANEKGILIKGTKAGQYRKTVEEVGELGEALINSDIAEVRDAIGDIAVTIIIQAHMNGLSFQECLDSAYAVISKRTGTMVDGVFVKAVENL